MFKICLCSLLILYILIYVWVLIFSLVTENQGQAVVTAPVAAKQNFHNSSQPYNRSGWNQDNTSHSKTNEVC